ncbi:hypothetical protein [Fuchsiella alkaliacetigena]|uniref:hypothetical protein n=1 Tax=Fuchsiella alkaliacetigena TaxID=957042 RepID=UPI00200AED68|nr:hypothetical protein [Fuchsiella alkaliacetigena]MCK8824102.1 hypothetical protein [Fuchsiella alkaliacetigena]
MTAETKEELISEVETQLELYQQLLELIRKENNLLEAAQEIDAELLTEKREVRDQIAKIDLVLNAKNTSKFELMQAAEDDKLTELKSILEELYSLEKENQRLAK